MDIPRSWNWFSEVFYPEVQQAVNQNEKIASDKDVPIDVDTTSQRLQANNIFDIFYAKSVILEGELSSAKCKLLLVATMES